VLLQFRHAGFFIALFQNIHIGVIDSAFYAKETSGLRHPRYRWGFMAVH